MREIKFREINIVKDRKCEKRLNTHKNHNAK